MSIFKSVSIQGIRSYDPKKAQVLNFLNPVTLVLGQNGSGKTTIIESLRYATTGDFPPGSEVGGSFVHDSKLAQESKIKAEISLEVKDLHGNDLSVSWSLKATQKDMNKQVTHQDGSIKRILSNGEIVSSSYKCVEMTNSLGVSKAVLENVIFCHQEDSNWPLMEGKQVKQRFDELLASTICVKEHESVLKTKLEKETEIEQFKRDLNYLEINRDEAQKKLSEKQVLEKKVALLGAKIVEIKKKLDPIELSIRNHLIDMTEVESKLKVKMSEKTSNENLIKELEKNISEPINHDNTKLEEMIADSGRKLELMKSENNDIVIKISEIKATKKEIHETYNSLLVKKGGLATDIKEENVQDGLDENIATNNEKLRLNNDSISEMERNIESHKSVISNHERKIRELEHILSIRHSQRMIKDMAIRLLEDKLNKMKQELCGLEDTRSKWKGELDGVNNRSNKATNEINCIDKEFRDRYANAEHAYLQMVEEIEKASCDLEKSYKELNQRIMDHHKTTMTAINKILKELWTNIYCGKDIDCVEICCDEESTSVGSNIINYNYRVVMVKSDIKLDMRGRCSTEQKVLASLLIRLALAEVFCLHCGVLSLDEPTTDLDKEQIKNLSDTLVKIIKNRSKQKNFQLILTTHDEDFLQLSLFDYVDEFYKIHINASGHSEIQKMRIDH